MTAAELQGCMANPQSCATLGTPDGAVNEENETRACLFFETRCGHFDVLDSSLARPLTVRDSSFPPPSTSFLGPLFARFSAPPHPARAVCCALLGARADRVLIGGCNPML